MKTEQCMSIVTWVIGLIFASGICSIVHNDVLCRQVNLTDIVIQLTCDQHIITLDKCKVTYFIMYMFALSVVVILTTIVCPTSYKQADDLFTPDAGDLNMVIYKSHSKKA